MKDRLRRQQGRMGKLLLANLILGIAAPNLFTLFGGIWDYLLSFIVATLALTLLDRRYLRFLFAFLSLVLFLVKEIIVSNFALAWLVIQPKPKLDPGIIGVPLTARTDIEITALATSITLPPGTICVDLATNDDGGRTLYVHAFHVGDPEQLRANIKDGYERRILRVTRGGML
jgi:multicomponent Na+:H+ antiporter subunit E